MHWLSRKAILALLQDDEWKERSDRSIAKMCRVDHKTVGKLRKTSVRGEFPSEKSEARRTYTSKHGTKATMDTSNIGTGSRSSKEPTAVESESDCSR